MTEDSANARGTIAISIAVLLLVAMLGSFLLNPSERQQSNLNLIIGGLLTSLSTIVGWYFGSSQSSKNKDQLLANVVGAATGTGASSGSALTQAKPTGTADDPVATTVESVVARPSVTVESAAPPPAEPPPAPTQNRRASDAQPEPGSLALFRQQMKAMNPNVSEAQVLSAWQVIYP